MKTVYVVYGVPDYQDQDVYLYSVFAEKQQAIDCCTRLNSGLNEDGEEDEDDEYSSYTWSWESICFIE